jgi:hypothetical protein
VTVLQKFAVISSTQKTPVIGAWVVPVPLFAAPLVVPPVTPLVAPVWAGDCARPLDIPICAAATASAATKPSFLMIALDVLTEGNQRGARFVPR